MDRNREIKMVSQFQASSVYEPFMSLLKDVCEKSIKAHRGEYSMMDLQAELLGNILAVNENRKEYIRNKALCHTGLDRLLNKKAPQERINRAQDSLDIMNKKIAISDWMIKQLRAVGDGIAWRYLKYDRPTIRMLAHHEYVPVPQLDKGLITEMNRAQELFENKNDFVHNAITNVLRVGDLTFYDEKEGALKLLEVKSSDYLSAKLSRQTNHRTLIEKGVLEGWLEVKGIKIKSRQAQRPLLTFVKSIESAMDEADEKFASSRVFGDYFSVQIISTIKWLEKDNELDKMKIADSVTQRASSIFAKKDDLGLPLLSNLFAIANFIPSLAPYTIFPVPINRRIDLMVGNYLVICLMNVSGLARWLAKRGWGTQVIYKAKNRGTKHELGDIPMLKVWRPCDGIPFVKGVDVPLDLLEIAALEFWMPESIEESINTVLRQDESEISGYHNVNFLNTGKYAFD
ncbi:MAG: hypothetical protein NTZ34_10170 [Chloroflexi bacterium]|nr:hypothetical protein [Chloroflexota bacterium]